MLGFKHAKSRRKEAGKAQEASEHQGARTALPQKLAQGDEEAPLSEPWFPDVEDAVAANQQGLAEHGQSNSALLRPEVLEGALGRAQNYWYYEQNLPKAAAALAHGVGAAQAFEDGNKRTAYHLSRIFLDQNGLGHVSPLDQDDEELADHLLGHGAGTHTMDDTTALFEQRAMQRGSRTASREGWFSPSYHIPDQAKNQIHQWAQTLPWPEGSTLQSPDKYHITAFYSPEGYQDPSNREWISTKPQVNFPTRAMSVERFGDLNADHPHPIVLRFDSPEMVNHMGQLQQEGSARGMELASNPGGSKPHVTLGWVPPNQEMTADPLPLSFTAGPLQETHSQYDSLKGRQANILDPIHDQLDPRVWLHPGSPIPTLRPEHRSWIIEKIFSTLKEHGYDGMEKWLSLVFTGSLTTYQYSDQSDCDVSLFVDTPVFPEWSRADMVGLMVANIDGTTLPGTPHPMQDFVVMKGIEKADLYQPGLRSGYDVLEERWIVPPDRARVHDVESEMHQSYTTALENADKMDKLLTFEPQKAVMFYHQIHRRRMRDMSAGKGDYSPTNITYKMLNNRGYFKRIHDITGEYIA